MRRLQMGMWHQFSLQDWETYRTEQITGLEISQYKTEVELKEVHLFCERNGFAFGIHSPVLEEQYDLPQLASPLKAERVAALKRVEREAKIAASYGADYILFHFPYPPIYSEEKNLDYWLGYPDHHPYLKSGDLYEKQFLQNSRAVFESLCEIQIRTGQKIVLEYDFFGDFEDAFAELFKTYRDIELVIDTQRIDVHKRNFFNFDPYQWLAKIADCVYLAHYSNTRYRDPFQRHLPVLKRQCLDANYGDAYQYLQFLSQKNSRFHVTFEHNPSLVTKSELHSCYEDVAELLQLKIEN
jgi:sugar phosphate isomerase/epimerase